MLSNIIKQKNIKQVSFVEFDNKTNSWYIYAVNGFKLHFLFNTRTEAIKREVQFVEEKE